MEDNKTKLINLIAYFESKRAEIAEIKAKIDAIYKQAENEFVAKYDADINKLKTEMANLTEIHKAEMKEKIGIAPGDTCEITDILKLLVKLA